MELTELKTKIIESFTGSAGDLEEVLQMVEDDQSIFPFNEKAGLELLSGSVSKEVQDFLRTSFLSWCDINRGFLWKS